MLDLSVAIDLIICLKLRIITYHHSKITSLQKAIFTIGCKNSEAFKKSLYYNHHSVFPITVFLYAILNPDIASEILMRHE